MISGNVNNNGQETSTDPIRSNVLRMAPLYSFRGFPLLLFYFLRCLVGFEQRQELLSPFASNKNTIELSSRLAYDPWVAYAARSRSSL